ncbi:hypothetical protein FRACYDRAFT_238326 [Fragilariopsis cylindrus CCMP1102]|uniref:RMT2 domain-containing protein n=1 Tax=Fragilariopsis cylindrus CCMP1102 TaxID=635003 RepID=A0A1E7FI99_9STRA|nr:hypothetical protein FRACYDRAFT_238326 [Fragilariopsis cylindrus CCMP1102]|eukprot:OEU17896.1 hypothetical protein FRACYDRAFT_238326 [Fragilariopsis cylindrus CCMP1102]
MESSTDTTPPQAITNENVHLMLTACQQGDIPTIQRLTTINKLYCCQQDNETGLSPLMIASQSKINGNGNNGKQGNIELVQFLLQEGNAPWNAVCRLKNKCAGDYATDSENWDIVNLLVDWGTRAELILGTLHKQLLSKQQQGREEVENDRQRQKPSNSNNTIPVEEQSSTKTDYLQHKLTYSTDNSTLIDEDNDAVMMEWERPIMKCHAQILLEDCLKQGEYKQRRVLNVGFGLGIIDTILQEEYQPHVHYIIEAHPDVYHKMIVDGWDKKPGVVICYGKWQEILPKLRSEQYQQSNNIDGSSGELEFDGIFFDTYAEHSYDMEDFHQQITMNTSQGDKSSLLSRPHGVYSFFNGLAPDNLFFHGVACNVVKLQLSTLGLDTDFLTCQMTAPTSTKNSHNNNATWDGIRRKYWHGRDVYYLPKATWNSIFIGQNKKK